MASRGELEHRILEVLWGSKTPLTVAAVHRDLHPERDLAYTTVMTVLDRLAKKGLADRELVGRAWEYRPALTQAELVARDVIEAVGACPPELRREVLARVNSVFNAHTSATAS